MDTCNNTGTQSVLSGNTTTAMVWLRRLAPQGPGAAAYPVTGVQERPVVWRPPDAADAVPTEPATATAWQRTANTAPSHHQTHLR